MISQEKGWDQLRWIEEDGGSRRIYLLIKNRKRNRTDCEIGPVTLRSRADVINDGSIIDREGSDRVASFRHRGCDNGLIGGLNTEGLIEGRADK
jgi:hypothetical protein